MSHLSLAFHAPAGAGQGPPPGSDRLDVRHFVVIEGLSELFSIHLVALSPSTELDPEAYVGADVTFRIAAEEGARAWSGVVVSFELVELAEGGLSTYEIAIAPRLALLEHRVNCRIFQRQTAVGIVTKLLGEWAIDVEIRGVEHHKRLEYRVQYHESDFAFLHRILSEDGISYFFEDGEGKTTLVLSDQPARAEVLRPALPYRSTEHDDTREPHVRFVVARKEVRHEAVTVSDFDLRRPAYGLHHTAEHGSRSEGVRLEHHVYRPGSSLGVTAAGSEATDTPVADAMSMARTDEHHGRHVARVMLEGLRGLEVELQSNVLWLAPGSAFLVSAHPKLDGRRLLVTGAQLRGDSTGSFAASVRARHCDRAIRPPQVVRPLMPGMQSASVVGAPGAEIHTDEFGRVRVQFHWDREGAFDDKSTCWLRVAEGWGGAGFGLLSLPRVGHEVLVDFVAGNPDEPIIVGRVHGGTTPTPFGLPAHPSKTGWRTRSTPGGQGFHELSFEDRKGEEVIFVRSEKDLRCVVQHEEHEIVGRDRVGQIGKNLTTFIKANDLLEASASSAAVGKIQGTENIQRMGAPTVTSTLTLREMVPGKIALTTGGTMIELLDDEIFVVADERLVIKGKEVDIRGGPFVHINPAGAGAAPPAKKELQDGHVVWFELRDKGGKPLPNLECHVMAPSGEASHVQKTDGQGRVLFNVDKPGDYRVVVGKPDEASKPTPKAADKPVAHAASAHEPAKHAAPAQKPTLAGNKSLHINSEGLKLIRKTESFYSKPYIDPVGIPTIGYGTIQYPDGRKVTMGDPPITKEQAEHYMRFEVSEKEEAVRHMVKVPLNENQFSSLTSFAYNVGVGNLQTSTLLKKLNASDYEGASGQFGRWNKGKDRKTGKLVVLRGLTNRRATERALFDKPVSEAAPTTGGVQAPGGAPTAHPSPPAPKPAASKPAAPKPVEVGTTPAKPTTRPQMTEHMVPLEVTVASPTGSEKLVIDPGTHPGKAPSMPSVKLKASATLNGHPVPEGSFRWQLHISGQYKTRMGMKDYNLLAGEVRTQPGQEVAFKLAPPSVVGGQLTVKVQFEHPSLGTLAKTIKGAKVQGKNPTKAAVKALIKEIEPAMGWILFPVIEQESGYRQFKTPDKVLVGPPAGIGVSQRDSTTDEWGNTKFDPSQPNIFFPRIYWDWKENVRVGMELFREKQRDARRYMDGLRKKHNLPQYTDGMLARETLRRYNGGIEWSAENGHWKVDPHSMRKGKRVPLPKGRDGYVDEVIGRMNRADIPASHADITKKTYP